MKKILIWDTFPLANIGGPSGYLYNIHEYLKKQPTEQITFLSDYLNAQGINYKFQQNNFVETKYSSYLQRLFRRIKTIYDKCYRVFRDLDYSWLSDVDFSQFDYIHVHKVEHVVQIKRNLKHFNGKVILTSHCPSSWSEETINGLISVNAKMGVFRKWLFRNTLKREIGAYRITDYIMFPCKEAREPYEKVDAIKSMFAIKNTSFFYVPTSIVDYKPSQDVYLKDYGIPEHAFVIGFFGRHNWVKGYDILAKIGIDLLNKYPNLYFLCAGGGDIDAPIHERWIELGYIHNVDDILPLVDLYILPNRDTYFDLIVLQALRASIPLVLSRTGGNKYFENLPKSDINGLRFFDLDNCDLLKSHVHEILSLKDFDWETYQEMRTKNHELFESYFSMSQYVATYVAQINQLD